MASKIPNIVTNDESDLADVEDIEQLCSRIPCNDERFVKMFSLSFETMIRSIVADCARVNKENNIQSKTLTSQLLNQTLLNKTTDDNNSQSIINSQQTTISTSDINDLFDL